LSVAWIWAACAVVYPVFIIGIGAYRDWGGSVASLQPRYEGNLLKALSSDGGLDHRSAAAARFISPQKIDRSYELKVKLLSSAL
jgi:hypothetical protein